MSDVANELRERNPRHVESLSIDERLELAFALGEDDLEIYRAANGFSFAEALAHRSRLRQLGRRPCSCFAVRPP